MKRRKGNKRGDSGVFQLEPTMVVRWPFKHQKKDWRSLKMTARILCCLHLRTGIAEQSGGLLRVQKEIIPRAVSSPSSEEAGSLTSCSRLTIPAVEHKWAAALPMSCWTSSHVMAPPKRPGKSNKGSPKSSDSRHKHKRTNKVLWIEGEWNPPWVKADLPTMTQGQAQSGDRSNFDVHHGHPGQEHNRVAGLNQAQLFDSDTCTATTAFGRGRRETINKNSSHTCGGGDLRTLCKAGRLKDALHILNQRGIWADSNTYICVLQECISMRKLTEGRQVHSHISQSGLKPNIFLFNTLLDMYAKCGSMVDARQVFENMPERDVFTWTIMMAGYAKHRLFSEAVAIYEQMIQEGVSPNMVTFACILNVYASLGDVEKGKQVHAVMGRSGIVPDVILENSLVNMYARCEAIKDARQVFDNMAGRNVVSWNTMIAGYSQHGCGSEALEMYDKMILEGVRPNRVTFICVLNACASLGAIDKGREVHANIIKAGISAYINLENTLVNMYAKCGSMKDACQLFNNMAKRNLVSWNTIIGGYAQHGCSREAFKIYEQMQNEGIFPDKVTFTCILNACASQGALGKGREVHADIIKAGIGQDIILETALVDMYTKCGSVKDAGQVFDSMANRNEVSWKTMITGYARHGCDREAVKIYDQMQRAGMSPCRFTVTCVLHACASLGALEKGKGIHANILKGGIVPDMILETALVDMYAKCGSMENARQVFDNMTERDVMSWNVMIAGYGQHGCVAEAFQLFQQMQQEGLKPETITLLSLLSACSHVGLVDEGRLYFDSMSRDHDLTPTVEHFSCMVDLLGRAGRLEEAEDLIKKMSIEPGASMWRALLGACRIHGNLELAERVTKCLLKEETHI